MTVSALKADLFSYIYKFGAVKHVEDKSDTQRILYAITWESVMVSGYDHETKTTDYDKRVSLFIEAVVQLVSLKSKGGIDKFGVTIVWAVHNSDNVFTVTPTKVTDVVETSSALLWIDETLKDCATNLWQQWDDYESLLGDFELE